LLLAPASRQGTSQVAGVVPAGVPFAALFVFGGLDQADSGQARR
jgi:hypothetical protein